MADILDEDPIPFAEAIRSLPGRPHISWGYRAIRGIRGVALETFMVGGRRFTTHGALRRFIIGVTAASAPRLGATPPRRNDSCDSRIEQALDDAGI